MKNIKFLGMIFIIVILVILSSRFKITKVCGNSMSPTFEDGEIVLVDMNAKPKDGDVIILDMTKMENWNNSTTQIIKRYYEDLSNDGFYVLGDNSEVSYDSRFVGDIPKSCLKGVVIFKL